jgi:hypothetical protein
VITFVGGLFFLLEFLLPAEAPSWLGGVKNPLTPYLPVVTDFQIVVGTMAFLLGPLNLVRTHLAAVIRRNRGWMGSVVFLVSLVAGVLAASLQEEDTKTAWTVLYNVLFYGIMMAFGASSMALLAFYLVSAAHRAFRMSNWDSGVMMVSATIVLLGMVPLGDWITYALPKELQFRTWTQWILVVPNAAVQRAVLIGASGGAFATALRHWLNIGTRSE